jgi:hypothetical protein
MTKPTPFVDAFRVLYNKDGNGRHGTVYHKITMTACNNAELVELCGLQGALSSPQQP